MAKEENDPPLYSALKQASARTDDEALARFYEWVAVRYSSRKYAKVMAAYGSKISPKFFDVCERARRLMPVAKLLSWHTRSDLNTLDLGTGAGHMGLIANHFGHSAIGIDGSHLFDGLREFWLQPAIIHRIEARAPLPDEIGRFHSITSILTNYGRRWSVDDWGDFLDRIIEHHLEPDGEFVIHFPGNQALDYREYLRRRASRLEGDGRLMFFTRN